MVYGSLVPWHDEWYWSGTQLGESAQGLFFREAGVSRKKLFHRLSLLPGPSAAGAGIRRGAFRGFRARCRLDAAWRPRSAAEQKRLRVFSEIKAGEDLEKILKKHGVKRPGQGDYPRKFVENEKGVAVFYHEGEGIEMFTGYGILLSGLKKQDEPLTPDEMEILQAFVEEDAISPAFVRRVIRDVGSSGLEKLYFLTSGADGVEYLLRRFKGCYYRKRPPNISLRE